MFAVFFIFILQLFNANAFVSNNAYIHFRQSSVYIAGTVKGIDRYLNAVMGNSYMIASMFKAYTVVIYCNATDIGLLADWMSSDVNVHVVQELPYGPGFDYVPARLAVGRNKLVERIKSFVRERNESLQSTFIVMMDLDDVNENIFNRTVLVNAMAKNDQWDAVSFNRQRYYDIWALRYKKFIGNVWAFGHDSHKLVDILMNDISTQLQRSNEQFYPVYSAFNGIAIYKLAAIRNCRYDGENRESHVISPMGDCEHVAFHKCMREENGARIVIDKNDVLTKHSWLTTRKNEAHQDHHTKFRFFIICSAGCVTVFMVVWLMNRLAKASSGAIPVSHKPMM